MQSIYQSTINHTVYTVTEIQYTVYNQSIGGTVHTQRDSIQYTERNRIHSGTEHRVQHNRCTQRDTEYSVHRGTVHLTVNPSIHQSNSPGLLVSRPYQLLNVLNRLTFPLYERTHGPNTARTSCNHAQSYPVPRYLPHTGAIQGSHGTESPQYPAKLANTP